MILRANALQIPLADQSVHCVVTSPPYWGLRDYGVNGQLGLERTMEEYVANMVQVFREVWRVLRDDGTCWINLGDSYTSDGRDSYGSFQPDTKQATHPTIKSTPRARQPNGLKPKDLVGIPWRVAFALQADGWYLRSDIIWSKPNPMPESVTDRPTKAHEYIFLLSKSPKYFFDQEAVREKAIRAGNIPGGNNERGKNEFGVSPHKAFNGPVPSNRNIRTVWEIATQSFSGAHFATFPEELVRRCMFAGTSEKGCCPKCGGPWVRMVEHKAMVINRSNRGQKVFGNAHSTAASGTMLEPAETKTLGWQPSCSCNRDCPDSPVPGVVLDPFSGSGTVGVVCQKFNRRFVGLELKPDYCRMANKRIWSQDVAML